MTPIQTAAREKLLEMQAMNNDSGYIAQLMYVGIHLLEMKVNMYDLDKIENMVLTLFMAPEIKVERLLRLATTEEEIIKKINSIKTDQDVAQILLMDLLYRAMEEYLDNFPTNLRMSPVEKMPRSKN
jgi:hypothetical protein